MHSDVALGERSQDRIDKGVQNDISVGMAG
jgi:hypothetical protein